MGQFCTVQADLVANIADLVDKGTITGVSDVRDESDRTGMRIVVEARRGSAPEVMLQARNRATVACAKRKLLDLHGKRLHETAILAACSSDMVQVFVRSQVILNNLYKHTVLQTRFACNMVALVDSTPQSLSLKDFLQHFLDFR